MHEHDSVLEPKGIVRVARPYRHNADVRADLYRNQNMLSNISVLLTLLTDNDVNTLSFTVDST